MDYEMKSLYRDYFVHEDINREDLYLLSKKMDKVCNME